MSRIRTWKRAWGWVAGEQGFTLLEVMIAIVVMTIGLLAVADVFPGGLAMSLYGKDQTAASNLAQQKIDYYKNQVTSTLPALVGDYGTVASEYFDESGNTTTQAAAYFTRDVQIQYWTYSAATNKYSLPASPYAAPATGTVYVFRVSAATHWAPRGQTAFTSGHLATPNGCVVTLATATAVPTGRGCIQISTFIKP